VLDRHEEAPSDEAEARSRSAGAGGTLGDDPSATEPRGMEILAQAQEERSLAQEERSLAEQSTMKKKMMMMGALVKMGM